MNVTLYNKKGDITEEDKDVFAKSVGGLQKGSNYYILTHNSYPYDPYGPDSTREKTLSLKLRQTNKEAFQHYTKYLNTRNSLYFTLTLRNFLNG